MKDKPNIFKYDNYRTYLADMMSYKKATRSTFSYRVFSRKAGFASPNFLKLVIENKRNVSLDGVLKLAKGFSLDEKETSFLLKLVEFNQEKDFSRKSHLFEALFSNASFKRLHRIQKKQFNFYHKWWHTVIREMVNMETFREDAKWISDQLGSPVTPRLVTSSLKLLIKQGFLKRNAEGKLEQANSLIETGEEVKSLAIKAFHEQMIQRAVAAMHTKGPADRDISSLCLGIAEEDLPLIKERIIKFRQELIQFIGREEKTTAQIVQINIQLFTHLHLRKPKKKGNSQ